MHFHESNSLFPDEGSITKLMRYFWRTAVLRVKACEISLAASRALACRDVQTLINHPVVGRYVKDLQLSAGMVRAVCVPSVCVLLFLFDNALYHVKNVRAWSQHEPATRGRSFTFGLLYAVLQLAIARLHGETQNVLELKTEPCHVYVCYRAL